MSTAIGVSLPRLSTAVGKAVSEYAVLGKTPGFTADFIKNKYPGKANFASAITHSRSGNATMTDGYGPELVVNGGFDSGTDGWSVAGTSCTLSYDNGKAQTVCTGTDGNSRIGRSVGPLTAGTAYIFTLQYYEASSYGFIRVTSGSIAGSSIQQEANTTNNGNRRVTMVFVPSTTQEYFVVAGGNFTAGSVSTFDNVSVREMPVLKWAPHNVSPYSEQFDQWTQDDVTVSLNSITAPNGTTTADKIVEDSDNSNHFVSRNVGSVVAGATYTSSVFAKAGEVSILQASHSFLANTYANFDLSSGTVTAKSSSVVATITDVGDGWYLCEAQSPYISSGTAVNAWMLQESGTATRGAAYQGDGTSGLYLWGAHFYRSDLGGMVDNPERGDSYVPTTSSAVYLPRIGHHVYNGSAWVNEGLLAESEARTNLQATQDFSTFVTAGMSLGSSGLDGVSPTGEDDSAYLFVEDTSAGLHRWIATGKAVTSGADYTMSVYAKDAGRRYFFLREDNTDRIYASFDLEDGVILSSAGPDNIQATMEPVGNGWYRCSVAGTTSSTTFVMDARFSNNGATLSYTGDGTSGVYFYGLQLESGSTPSSLIPTSGSSVTRAAETFTIPSANLPWSQSYGTEVSASSWTGSGWDTFTSTGDDFSANKSTGGGTDHAYSDTAVTVVSGQSVKIDVDFDTGTNTQALIGLSSTTNARSNLVTVDPSAGGTKSVTVTATQSGTFSISVRTTLTGTINVTGARAAVVTNGPVSIAMDGRMTYADTDSSLESLFVSWYEDADNRIRLYSQTSSASTGRIVFEQEASNVNDYVITSQTLYSPDILVPFSIASRHGSTFVNGATDGVALTANTTPTALPDLSSTNLLLASDYMGTIGTFRVWDRDIADTGLVEATNPSLEPSLSLTFEGVATNSFVVNDWSE